MSAQDIIAQIQQLPDPEKTVVYSFVAGQMAAFKATTARDEAGPRFMSTAKARDLSQGIFTRNAELFRKLAQ